ncbi:hypothetical protein J2792_002338 [Novosphingobium capsulatum]|uniref:Uncharacterized protein n=1 Tax=Novosphingobium capsulatum TaxID=13688 RepID=A0ABU1MMA5_9SPHN|nr:hypothetical protein [Novosphingobium capsulatum]MDR6511466.1 hypothetical protein [Novosphingobium capsulatum]
MPSFLYPRTVAFHRPAGQTKGGRIGYGGQTQANETVVATGIPASIQERKEGIRKPTGLPSDGRQPEWWVFISRPKLANGTLKVGDVMIDDLGNRYQVLAPYWDSLGYRLTCALLEV